MGFFWRHLKTKYDNNNFFLASVSFVFERRIWIFFFEGNGIIIFCFKNKFGVQQK
jgi:hypothetical protein